MINHYIFNQNNRPSHHLQISSVSSVAQYFLPEVIAKLFVISPNLHIELQEERLRKNIFKAIQDNCIDIGIVNHMNQDTQKIAETFQKKGFQMEFLYSCSMSYYVRTDHPLLFVHHIDPQILAQYELISNEGILEFSQNKIPFEHIHEEQNIRYIKQMLCVNDFIAILPDFYSENDPYIQNHQIVRLAQFPLEATTNFSALYNPQNEIAKYFRGFLKQEFAQLV